MLHPTFAHQSTFLKAFLLKSMALLALGGASAATWTGAGEDDNWTTGANWGGTAPASGAALVFDGATRTTPVNDFAAGTAFNGISFAAGAAPFTLTGEAIRFSGTLANESAARQTLALPITFAGTGEITINANGGDIVQSGMFSFTSTEKQNFRKYGPGAWIFAGEHTLDNAYPEIYLRRRYKCTVLGMFSVRSLARSEWTPSANP